MVRAMLVCASALFAISCVKANGVDVIKADGEAQVAVAATSGADMLNPRAQELRDLAEKGDAKKQFRLGQAYELGLGVPKDPAEAMRWYRLAAGQREPVALFHVGNKLWEGSGEPKNEREALWHWMLSAEQGFAPAQAALGKLLSTGSEKIVIDKVQAYMWLSLASTQGDQEAERRLAALTKGLQPKQMVEARKLLQQWRPARIISVVRSVSK